MDRKQTTPATVTPATVTVRSRDATGEFWRSIPAHQDEDGTWWYYVGEASRRADGMARVDPGTEVHLDDGRIVVVGALHPIPPGAMTMVAGATVLATDDDGTGQWARGTYLLRREDGKCALVHYDEQAAQVRQGGTFAEATPRGLALVARWVTEGQALYLWRQRFTRAMGEE